MAEEKVVTLRFQERKSMDMELYQRLEDGKNGLGLSMPTYVKGILWHHFEDGERSGTRMDGCMERIQEIVHGEVVSQSAVLAGMLEKIMEGSPERMSRATQTGGLPERGDALPGYSDSLPEGFGGVLEKFM